MTDLSWKMESCLKRLLIGFHEEKGFKDLAKSVSPDPKLLLPGGVLLGHSLC